MNFKLVRTNFTENSTTGVLFLDGNHECYILEDTCREDKPGTWDKSLKIPGKTAIPYGKYQIIVTFSDRFQRPLPLVLNVPDFEGIRIHPGNAPKDTEGCLLPGLDRGVDWVSSSLAAFNHLFRKILTANETEKIWIEVTKA